MGRKIIHRKDRRSYVRLETELPVRFKICSGQSDKIYSATTRNISHSGICLNVHQDQAELFDKLSAMEDWPTVEVAPQFVNDPPVPASEPVWIISRLGWVQKPTVKHPALLMGLDFIDMPDNLRRHFHDCIVGEFLRYYERVDSLF